MDRNLIQWLIDSDEPWTRYRTLIDLLEKPIYDTDVTSIRSEMLAHTQVQQLIAKAVNWPGYALRRHNDPQHPIYALSTLADFGLHVNDPCIQPAVQAVLAHQSSEGAFQTLVNIPRAFGGDDQDAWTWILCDSPTLLYALLAMGCGNDPKVQRAVDHLASTVRENGWPCKSAQELGKFRGPGRKEDPCPIANVYVLKALAQVPAMMDSQATRQGAEMLLRHWEHRGINKHYLFGIGSDFRKLKYPFIWYDILHVVDVLSQFNFVHPDPRFQEMIDHITAQADTHGRYMASSMYRAWTGWSFADKKSPSPWLTFLALRIQKRITVEV